MKIKTYQDWLTESKTGLIQSILERIEPTITSMLERAVKAYEEEFKRPMSQWEQEMTRLQIIYDLARSIEAYTATGDQLIQVSASGSPKGSIVISAQVERNGVLHPINTDVIYAGGYNIQRLHYRYLTKTTLPKSNATPEADQIKAEMKRLSKGEKLKAELDRQLERIAAAETKIATAKAKSEAEIEAEVMASPEAGHLTTTWAEIVARGADKNYRGQAEFEQEQESYRQGLIDIWKAKAIIWPGRDIEAARREVAKLEKGLEALVK